MKSILAKHSNGLHKPWLDEATHKIYPFYISECLGKNSEDDFDLICDSCGYNEPGNRVVKCAMFVFYDKDTVKCYCSRECRPDGCILYDNQIYGFDTPVQLPAHLQNSLLHTTVWHYLYESHKYKLNHFLGKKITVELLEKEFYHSFFPEWQGSTGPDGYTLLNRHGYISVDKKQILASYTEKEPYHENGRRSLPTIKEEKKKSFLEITPAMIATTMQEILSPQQFSLF